MFFIMGISNGRKELDYAPNSIHICKKCASYCRYKVYCTYMVLTVFFIPLFKWSKEYYVECSGCGTVFSLNKNLGKSIEHGADIIISADDIEEISCYQDNQYKKCPKCGYMAEKGFEFCPKCGEKFLY